ncbi:hypothetical protein ACSQ76_16535 [Roseovarius sp. B08]|uniref:hypothetical protein n=1 Tax=Roseovarius sp. B08 TaxID=3449223 RepID=UPI003EDBF367
MLLAVPAWAAELGDDYEAIGTMTVTLDGETMEMVIPYDVERERAYAKQRMIVGSSLSINAVGRMVDEDGTPGRPMVQVTLLEQGGEMRLLSAEIFDDQGYDAPLAMGADGGDGTLTAYEMTGDNVVTATVRAVSCGLRAIRTSRAWPTGRRRWRRRSATRWRWHRWSEGRRWPAHERLGLGAEGAGAIGDRASRTGSGRRWGGWLRTTAGNPPLLPACHRAALPGIWLPTWERLSLRPARSDETHIAGCNVGAPDIAIVVNSCPMIRVCSMNTAISVLAQQVLRRRPRARQLG